MIFGDVGWGVTVQDRTYYLFEKEDRRIFVLRLDFIVTRPDGVKFIMDRK